LNLLENYKEGWLYQSEIFRSKGTSIAKV